MTWHWLGNFWSSFLGIAVGIQSFLGNSKWPGSLYIILRLPLGNTELKCWRYSFVIITEEKKTLKRFWKWNLPKPFLWSLIFLSIKGRKIGNSPFTPFKGRNPIFFFFVSLTKFDIKTWLFETRSIIKIKTIRIWIKPDKITLQWCFLMFNSIFFLLKTAKYLWYSHCIITEKLR